MAEGAPSYFQLQLAAWFRRKGPDHQAVRRIWHEVANHGSAYRSAFQIHLRNSDHEGLALSFRFGRRAQPEEDFPNMVAPSGTGFMHQDDDEGLLPSTQREFASQPFPVQAAQAPADTAFDLGQVDQRVPGFRRDVRPDSEGSRELIQFVPGGHFDGLHRTHPTPW